MMQQSQDWLNQFPVVPNAPRGAPQPLIPRQPSPVRPVEQAIDEQRLRALELANANAATVNAQGLTPEAIHLQAQQYILNGQLPPLGMGRAAASARQAIINEAARLAGVSGRSGADLAAGFARFRNSQHTLQTLDNQLGTIRGNEATALANAQQFLDRIHELYPPGSTRLGNMVRHGINEFLNDPTQAAYNAAYTTFLTEYAKVVAGSPSGAGVLSDSARHEAMDMLSNATSPEAAERAVNQMRADMQNRVQSLQGNIERGYGNLSEGRPASFAPNGDILDDHGAVVPVSRNGGGGAAPPVLGQPPAGPSGSPPAGGGRMDATTVNMGEGGADQVSLNTAAMERQPDPALAGLNAHVQGMLHGGKSDAEIRQYIQDRGIPIEQIPGFDSVLAWRAAHPNYTGSYRVELDQHLVPVSTFRNLATNFADNPVGAAGVAAGNMVAGQQIPNIVGATGGDAELAQLGVNEIRNRHPYASVAGDVAGGALTYAGATGAGRLGASAAESLAPSLWSRLPQAITGAERIGAAGETIAAPSITGTLAPRAIAADAALGAYESPGNRLEGGVVGGLTGMAGRGIINSAARGVSPTGGALAPAYEEGVQPTLGQRMGGPANRLEQAFQSIPILGGIQRGARNSAIDQWQLGGFNRALRNLPDEPQLPAMTPEGVPMAPGEAPHAFAQDQFDNAYNRVHQRVRVVPDPELHADLDALRQAGNSFLSDSSVSHFNRLLDNSVMRRLTDPRTGAGLTGEELQKTISEVRRVARNQRSSASGDTELADMLDDVTDALHANAARHSAPEAIQTLNNINRGYAMLARIETASARGPAAKTPGTYSPATLMSAERTAPQAGIRSRQFSAGNGLMSNYAKAGLELGQTVGDSGTGERLMALGGAGAAGVLPHFAGTAGILPAAVYGLDTLATLPGVRNAVNWALKPNRASIRPFSDELRAQLQARAGVGSTIGLPAVVAAYGQGQ